MMQTIFSGGAASPFEIPLQAMAATLQPARRPRFAMRVTTATVGHHKGHPWRSKNFPSAASKLSAAAINRRLSGLWWLSRKMRTSRGARWHASRASAGPSADLSRRKRVSGPVGIGFVIAAVLRLERQTIYGIRSMGSTQKHRWEV
jgi:hypothetical protein